MNSNARAGGSTRPFAKLVMETVLFPNPDETGIKAEQAIREFLVARYGLPTDPS